MQPIVKPDSHHGNFNIYISTKQRHTLVCHREVSLFCFVSEKSKHLRNPEAAEQKCAAGLTPAARTGKPKLLFREPGG